jgi:hypothetical protein
VVSGESYGELACSDDTGDDQGKARGQRAAAAGGAA